MTDYTEDQLLIAVDAFLKYVDVTRLKPHGFSLSATYNNQTNLSVDMYWHNSSGNLEIFFDPSGKPEERCILTLSQVNENSENFDKEIRKACSEYTHISSLLAWVITRLGEYQSAPNDIEIEFIFDLNDGLNGSRIVKSFDEVMESFAELESLPRDITSGLPAGVATFNTRWELIIDLFDNLQSHGLSCAIGPEDEDHIYVLEELEDQCIDLTNERELYVYIMGMCSIVETLFDAFEEDKVPVDEVAAPLAALRNALSVLKPFLPDAYFDRFFA